MTLIYLITVAKKPTNLSYVAVAHVGQVQRDFSANLFVFLKNKNRKRSFPKNVQLYPKKGIGWIYSCTTHSKFPIKKLF